MKKRMRRWLGRLSEDQQQLVDRWSTRLKPLGSRWMTHRERSQRQLRELLGRRHDPAFGAELYELLVNFNVSWPPDYRADVDLNRQLFFALIIDMDARLSARQREKLSLKLKSLATKLERLSCSDRDPASIKPAPA